MVGEPHVFLLVFLIHPCCYSLTRAQPPFWISEVYNSFYNFSDVFVEIFDGGRGNVSLSNVSLDLEKEDNQSLIVSLDNMTTNQEGFLVLSLDDSVESIKTFLKNIQNETVILKLTISQKLNDSHIIDIFNKKKGWSDLISCFRKDVTVDAIVLVGNEATKGKDNGCPLSPVRIDLLTCKSPFNFTVQLISHGIDHFSLDNHVISLLENNVLNESIPLTNYTTQNGKVNISFAISQSFNENSTYSINLELKLTPHLFIILDSLYFGAQTVPVIPLNQTFKTYPDKNPAQMVTPEYLQLVPSDSSNFASCYCEVSTSTYYPFVKFNSSAFRTENCHKKCNELISMTPSTPTSLPKVSLKRDVVMTPNAVYYVAKSNVTDLNSSNLSYKDEISATATIPSTPEQYTTANASSTPKSSATAPGHSTSVEYTTANASSTPKSSAPGHSTSVEYTTANVSSTPKSSGHSTSVEYTTANASSTPKSSAVAHELSTLILDTTANTLTPERSVTEDEDSTPVIYATGSSTSVPLSTADEQTTSVLSSTVNGSSTTQPSTTAHSTSVIYTTSNGSSAPVSRSIAHEYSTSVLSSTVNGSSTPQASATARGHSTPVPYTTVNGSSTTVPSSTSKLATSSRSTSTQISTLYLYINEMGLYDNLDHWIELKGNESIGFVGSYVLVHNVNGRTNSTSFSLSNLKTPKTEEFLYINFNTPGAGLLLKDVNSKAGLLRLFNANVMTDCLPYEMVGTILESKLQKLCPLHKVKQITQREIDNNWTISRCKNKFEILEPSANETNKCPSKEFRKTVYMKILKKQQSKNFQTNFLSSLVEKLSADEGCMLSMAFFTDFSATNSGVDINIEAFLTAPDQEKLNALFMCYKTLFHIKPVALDIGTETVDVYRCYNDSFILPTIKVAAASTGTKQTLALVIPLLALFVCVVVGLVVYLRYKRKSLLGVLGIARYDADQDDLLVNMEDVGQVDTNFPNPTYSQLSVY